MKKALIALGVLLLIVVGAVWFVGSNLDGIIKTAIETVGSEVTQTKVSVAKVNIDLGKGAGSIAGLSVGNPKGFVDENIFSLGAISTKLDVSTVTKNPVVIEELIISAPQVFYEIDKAGNSNLDALKRNLEAATGGSGSSSGGGASSDSGTKLVINKLVVEKGSASMRIAALGGKEMSVGLPRIQLNDVGKDSGGASPAQVAEKVLKSMTGNVQKAVTGAGVQKYLGKSADAVQAGMKQLGGATGGAADQVGGALKGLLGK